MPTAPSERLRCWPRWTSSTRQIAALLLSTLGRIGGPAALQTIETAIADPALHAVGVRALCNWPDASVAGRLVEIFQSDEHPKDRDLALAALIRIAPLPDGRPDDERLALLKSVMGMCTRTEDQNSVIKRARAIYTVDTLRFVVPYLDEPAHAQHGLRNGGRAGTSPGCARREQGGVHCGLGQGARNQQRRHGARSGQSLQSRQDLGAAERAGKVVAAVSAANVFFLAA